MQLPVQPLQVVQPPVALQAGNMLQWIADRIRGLNEPEMYSYWLYLVSAFGIALAFLVLQQKLSVHTALKRIFARHVWLGRSARADYQMLALNELAFRVPNAVAFVAIVNLFCDQVGALGPAQALLSISMPAWLSTTLYTVVTLALLDVASYVTHRVQHETRLFWRFHAIHHSAETMNPLTVFRQHPVDMAMYTVSRGVIAGTGAGLFLWFVPTAGEIARLGGVNAGLFLFYLTAGLRHSHIPFAYPRWLRPVFFSPHMHQLHHSKAPRHLYCNYGVVFAVWDRLFGTYIDEAVPADIAYGLADGGGADPHNIVRMYLAPFKIEFKNPDIENLQTVTKGQR